jgi:hypothetical protein
MAAIFQQSRQPLRELPTLANGLLAESLQNPPDLVSRFLH